MRVSTRFLRNPIGAFLIIACLTAGYFFIFHSFGHTSDEANPLLSAYDMTHGNPLLKGWVEPASTFYCVDLLLIGAFTLVLGKSPVILVLVPALIWAVTVWSAAAIAASYCRPDRKTAAVFSVFVVLGLPTVFATIPIRLITQAPIHIGSIVYAMWLFVLAAKYLSQQSTSRWTMPLFIVVLTLLSMGDPFSPFFCALPICLACFTFRNTRRAYKLLAATIVGVIAGKGLLRIIFLSGGFEVLGMPASFVQFSNLPANASLLVQGILGLFGADFFGKAVDLAKTNNAFAAFLGNGPVVVLARLPFVALFCAALWAMTRAVLQATLSPIEKVEPMRVLLFWSIAVVIAANLFSTLPINILTSRYLLPMLVFGAILLAIEIPNTPISKAFITGALVISLVSLVSGYKAVDNKHRFAADEQQQLTDWLKANDLTQGYGQYWSAGIVTVLSGGKATVHALAATPDGKLAPFVWISSSAWFRKPDDATKDRFVIVDTRDAEPKITQENVLSTFGQPQAVYNVGPYIVDVYSPGAAIPSLMNLPG